MKSNSRQITFVVCIAFIGLIAWYIRSPKTKELSKTKETNLLERPATNMGVPVPEPAFTAETRRVEEIVGIGAVLKSDKQTGACRIDQVLPNSPAERGGLQAGLVIEKIDNIAIEGMSLRECVDLIRGSPGSKVRLDLIDPEQNNTITVELIREKVRI